MATLALSEGYCLKVVTASEGRSGPQGWVELLKLQEMKWGGNKLKRIHFPLNQEQLVKIAK